MNFNLYTYIRQLASQEKLFHSFPEVEVVGFYLIKKQAVTQESDRAISLCAVWQLIVNYNGLKKTAVMSRSQKNLFYY